MPALEIDKIQIQVSAQTGTAIKNLGRLKDSLGKLKEAVNECSNISSDGMDKLKELSQTIKTLAASGLGLKNVASALKTISGKSVSKVIKDIKESQEATQNTLNGFANVESRTVEGTVEQLEKGAKATRNFADEWKRLKKEFSGTRLGKGFAKISEFVSSLKRILMYRIIRSAIKALTQALSEGKDMYLEWSRSVGGEFAEVMDRLAVKFTLLKATIGSLAGEIITLLEPALQWLMNAVINVSNAFTQMFAHLNGSDTWNKAYIKDAQAVVDANKKLKQSFLGIDEINTLGNNNGNSAAQSLLGIGYEKTAVNEKTALTLESILVTVGLIGAGLAVWDISKFIGQLITVIGGGAGGVLLGGGAGGAGAGAGAAGGLLGKLLGAVSAIGGTILMTLGFKAQLEEGVNVKNILETTIGGALTGAGLTTVLLGASAGPYGLAFGILFSLIGTGVLSLVNNEDFKNFVNERLYKRMPWLDPNYGAEKRVFDQEKGEWVTVTGPSDRDMAMAKYYAEHYNEFAPGTIPSEYAAIIAAHPEWTKYDERGLNRDIADIANFAIQDPIFGNKNYNDSSIGGKAINLYLDGQIVATTVGKYQSQNMTQLGVYQ